MIRNKDVFDFLNNFAPFDTAEDWDNSGFLVGNIEDECCKIAVCLDITKETVNLAKEANASLIVSHHPVIFGARKRFLEGDPAFILAKSGISAICAHTCLDKAYGGVNEALAEKLGLSDVNIPGGNGTYVRTGKLPKAMDCAELAQYIKLKLQCPCVRFCGTKENIKTVAICSGSGADFIEEAFGQADAFITGDAGHHAFIDCAEIGIPLFAAGHFETENPIVPILAEMLKAEFPSLEIEILKQSAPVLAI